MPQPIEMGPQNEISQVTTEKAVVAQFEAHQHPPIDEDPGVLTVYYPINGEVYMKFPLMCVNCHCELKLLGLGTVDTR